MDSERLIHMNNINDHLYRCIILECHDQYLHVLTDQGEHLRIKNLANHHIGDKIYVLDEDIIRDTVGSNENKAIKIIDFIKPLSAIAAILLIVFFINFTMTNITYAVISLDINPSIELELNKSGEVIHAKGFNAEAIELLSNLQLKGFSYEKAIDAILNQAMLLGYTIDQHSVLIAVAPIKAQIEGLISDIENHLVIYTEQLGAEVKIGDQNSYTNEKNHDISLGRNLLSNENPNIDKNDMKNMKIKDIFEYIEKDQHPNEHPKNEEETKEHLDSEEGKESEDGKELEDEKDNSNEEDKSTLEDKQEVEKQETEKNDDQNKDSEEHNKETVDTITTTTLQENSTVEDSNHNDDGEYHETESEESHEIESSKNHDDKNDDEHESNDD